MEVLLFLGEGFVLEVLLHFIMVHHILEKVKLKMFASCFCMYIGETIFIMNIDL